MIIEREIFKSGTNIRLAKIRFELAHGTIWMGIEHDNQIMEMEDTNIKCTEEEFTIEADKLLAKEITDME